MNRLSQRNSSWGNIPLGFTNTYNPFLIKDYGCTITSIAMILGTTPDVVNARLKALPQGQGFSGSLVVWAGIEKAFPGVKARRVTHYDNNDVKNNVPNVLVEVPANAIGGTGKHWVVFVGNQKCYDPWTGLERSTSDFTRYAPGATGYCVITGKWNQPLSGNVTKQTLKDIVDGPGSDGDKLIKIRSLL